MIINLSQGFGIDMVLIIYLDREPYRKIWNFDGIFGWKYFRCFDIGIIRIEIGIGG